MFTTEENDPIEGSGAQGSDPSATDDWTVPAAPGSASRALRIVLCDDHMMLLEGMAAALAVRGHEVVAMTVNPARVAELVHRYDADICLLDISFPDGDGLAAAAEIRRRSSRTKVVILSGLLDAASVRRCVRIGVHATLRKDVGFADIVRLIESLGDDQITVDVQLLRDTLEPQTPPVVRTASRHMFAHLTNRERDVLRGIVHGDDTTTIARQLHISSSTARSHVQSLLAKMGVHSRLQALALVAAHGGMDALDADDERATDAEAGSV